ncbi:MAG TPA: hypothetical protein DIT99_18075, partial [Candidatus Latescibacteria bacterium]|nr:hypothetical protein [Candidatus Latescibacterota bacterium]
MAQEGLCPYANPVLLSSAEIRHAFVLHSISGRIAILDAGTGIRKLGIELIERGHEQFDNIIIALSHTRWD